MTTRNGAIEESLQRIGALDHSVADLTQRFNELDEKFNRIAATSAINTETISATVRNAESMIDRLEATITSFIAAFNTRPIQGETSRDQQPTIVHETIQVSQSSLERNRNDAELGYRCSSHRSENKEVRYKKIEMLVFVGGTSF